MAYSVKLFGYSSILIISDAYNIAYLQELVRNGPTTYPGTRYVVRDAGERVDLRYSERADSGWGAEQHLKGGE